MTTPPQPPNPGEYPPSEGYSPSGGYPPPPPGWGPPPQGAYPPPPPGAYPPPPGAYPPPPGWGTPPGGYGPPQGGYPPPGAYPPPPPAEGGWAPPPPGYGRPALSVGDGLSWAWNKFSKNAVPLLVATVVFGLIVFALSYLGSLLAQTVSPDTVTSYDTGDGFFETSTRSVTGGGILALLLSNLVQLVATSAVGCAYFAGLLDIADGRPVSVGSFFRPRNVGAVVIASLIVGIISTVGLLLCILPGLAFMIFAWFTTVAIVDRNLSPIDGIKASIDIVKRNFGVVLLFWLVSTAITLVGALLCGVGLLVAAPIAYLMQVYAFRNLSGQGVAPATA